MRNLFNSEVINKIREAFSDYVVMTDDGHGWFTKGKRSFTNPPFFENEYNSIVEAKFMMLLDFCGIQHRQISPGSIDTELNSREKYEGELVEAIKAEGKKPIGVSIHCDAWNDPEKPDTQNDANGFCVYYYEKDGIVSESGKRIARAVADAIAESDSFTHYVKPRHYDGIKGANFLMLRKTDAPWILIESGFMTNDEDLAFLKDDKFRNDRALAILTGLYNYIKQ
jgi:N-acetylmuramoyl-L-alanine amidase